MQFRIGDRDPVSGLYDAIWPDGSSTRNGIKIFNSAHEFGDVVLATQRSDGMIILDSVKAYTTEVATTIFGLGGFGEKPVGYLAGQVFNDEDEVVLPVVSVKFAPASPTSLAPNAGDFVVRIAIDRPQRQDLSVKCELTGTAPSGDYSYVGLDGSKIAIIPAGLLFKDVTITPTLNTLQVNETIIVKALPRNNYRIGADNIATATISAVAKPIITIAFAPGSPTSLAPNAGSFMVRVSANSVQTLALPVQCQLGGSAASGDYTIAGLDPSQIASIPAGSMFVDLTITPTNTAITSNKTIIVTALLTSNYTLGSAISVTATISTGLPIITLTISFPSSSIAIVKFQFDQPLVSNLQMVIDGTAELGDLGNLPGGDGSSVFVTNLYSSIPTSDPGVAFFTNASPFVMNESFLAGTSERSYLVQMPLYLNDVRSATMQIRISPDYVIAAGYVAMTLQVDDGGGGGGD